jgi:hypothetical protein
MKTSLCLLLLLAAGLSAQPAPPPLPPEARQFDFWLGDWEVFAPNGQKAGDNRIESMAGGWGLLENWTGVSGYTGKSLNTWFPDKRQWQQFWIGVGGALELSGGLNAKGEMVLGGRTTAIDGKETLQRITWTPHPDGTVRQHWEQSADGGTTWTTAFDGIYRRKANH